MKNLYTSVLLLLSAIVCNAQYSPLYNEMRNREMQSYQTLFRGENQTEATGLNYDVKYYKLEVRLNPDSTRYIRGAVTTYFRTNTANFNRINFDFASALICDSVKYHGVKLSAANIVKQGDTLKITIPTLPNAGTLDSIKVWYKGVPPQTTDFGGSTGFVKGADANSNNYLYTLSEPFSAFTWWPCKSRVSSDKADSLDIIVSTPSAFRVAANGKRISEDISGAQRSTIWRHRYPISSYQVAIGVAKYTQYPTVPTIVNIGGTNMELYNLLWTNITYSATALNRTAEMLTVFSSRFSDYPFKNEKYGHYTFGFGGGMEHNTMSGMGPTTMDASTDWSVIAHELGHQWFGASVTCGSWHDIWVNESFARYSEVVYLDGKTDASVTATSQSHRRGWKNNSLTNYTLKSIYQRDTTSMTTIFDPSVYIYDRGGMFVSMLRKTLGDTKFYQALRNYQLDPGLRYSNAFTDDVKRHMEMASGLDLSEMFNDWIYDTGHVSYSNARWNNIGNQVVLYLPQTRVSPNPSPRHFDMPIVLRFRKNSPALDTTIVLFDKGGVLHRLDGNGVMSASSGGSIIQVALPFTPDYVEYDPFSETLSLPNVATTSPFAATQLVKNPGLGLLATKVVDFSAVKNGNNALLNWAINQSVDYSSFEIQRSSDGTGFTAIGNRTAGQDPNATSFNHTDYSMPKGIVYYRIRIIEKDGTSFFTKVATVNNKSNESFTVSPNPATDHIMISHGASAGIIVNLKITDAAGKVVKTISKQTVAAGGKLRVALDNYASGTYYVEIEGEEYFKVVKKIALIK